MKKKGSHSAVVFSPGRWTENNIFVKGGLPCPLTLGDMQAIELECKYEKSLLFFFISDLWYESFIAHRWYDSFVSLFFNITEHATCEQRDWSLIICFSLENLDLAGKTPLLVGDILVNFEDTLTETSKSSACWDMGGNSHLTWLSSDSLYLP